MSAYRGGVASPVAGIEPDAVDAAMSRLPTSGSGSPAGMSRRFAAFAVDALGSWLVATLLTGSAKTGPWSTLVFVIEYALLVALTGQSAGMRLVGLRVVRLSGRPVGAWALGRVLGIFLIFPVLFTDRYGRGLHDRATGTVVVRT